MVTFYCDLAVNFKDCVDSCINPPLILSEATEVY